MAGWLTKQLAVSSSFSLVGLGSLSGVTPRKASRLSFRGAYFLGYKKTATGKREFDGSFN